MASKGKDVDDRTLLGAGGPAGGQLDSVPLETPPSTAAGAAPVSYPQVGGGAAVVDPALATGDAGSHHAAPVAMGAPVGAHDPYAAPIPTAGAVAVPPQHGDPYAAAPKVEEAGYRDVVWLFAFAVHVLAIIFMAFSMGVPALNAASREMHNQTDTSATTQVSAEGADESSIVGMLVVASLVGGAASAAWGWFLQRNAQRIITCTLYTSLAVQVIGALICMAFSPGLGVLLLIFAAITACYIYFVRKRIPFASANLSTACAAVRTYPATVYVAFAMLLAQLLWVSLWAMAFYGVQANSVGDGNFAEFFMLISLFWGQQVIANIVHVTTAGTVGTWWFSGGEGTNPTKEALRRACTTSLGSIALGSLIVAVLKAIKVMLENAEREARKRGGGASVFVLGCTRCIMGCVERLIEYFNKWAFVYVGLYGKDFRSAGGDVMRLFRDRGWTTIINDDLIDNALMIGSLVVGVITAVMGAGWAYGTADAAGTGWVFASALISFIIGVLMCLITTNVISSAVATVFVCFAENPSALAHTHPEHLDSLLQAWNTFHPGVMAECGYTARFASGGGAV